MTLPQKELILKLVRSGFFHTFAISFFTTIAILLFTHAAFTSFPQKAQAKVEESYWLLLHRKSNVEFLYYGTPGAKDKSSLIKKFDVKSGIPGRKPTPLPQHLGREYWTITDKFDSTDNPETAPYFLTLDIPVTDTPPYGPIPYEECNGQCDWELPGYFGLHGVSGDPSRVSPENEGSSGCIRHTDEDIAYLYNLLDPSKEEIRYYIEDI